MKSYHLCLGILLLSVLVGAQRHINHDDGHARGKKIRDVEEVEEMDENVDVFVDDIEVGLDVGKWYGDVGEKAFRKVMLKMHNEFRRNVSQGKVPNQPRTNGLRDLVSVFYCLTYLCLGLE